MDVGEAADDVVVVAVESDADEVDGDFLLLEFFSFCNYFFIKKIFVIFDYSWIISCGFCINFKKEKSES